MNSSIGRAVVAATFAAVTTFGTGIVVAHADPNPATFPGCDVPGIHYDDAGGVCYTTDSTQVFNNVAKPGDAPIKNEMGAEAACSSAVKGSSCQISISATIAKVNTATNSLEVNLDPLGIGAAAGVDEVAGQTRGMELRATKTSPPMDTGQVYYLYPAYKHTRVRFTIRGWLGAPGVPLNSPGAADFWSPTGGVVDRIASSSDSPSHP